MAAYTRSGARFARGRSTHTDRRDPRRCEEIHDAHAEGSREPHETVNCEVLAPAFEASEVARAHPEPFGERFARPAVRLA